MRIAPLLAGAAVALSMAAAAAPSNAAPAVPNMSTADTSAVVAARHGGPHWGGHRHWRHRHWGGPRIVVNACRAWRHECADRWPGLGWRYQRCLRNHGC